METQLLSDSSTVCRPSGSLDWMVAISLPHVRSDSLRPGIKVLIDLTRSITSTLSGGIVGSMRRVRATVGRLPVFGTSEQLNRLLQLAGVDRLVIRPSATADNGAA